MYARLALSPARVQARLPFHQNYFAFGMQQWQQTGKLWTQAGRAVAVNKCKIQTVNFVVY